MSPESDPTPPLAAPVAPESRKSQPSSCASSISDENHRTSQQRPKLTHRRRSASIIVDRDSSEVELTDEIYDEDDARTMSPRRNSRDVQKMGEEARRALEEYAVAGAPAKATGLNSNCIFYADKQEPYTLASWLSSIVLSLSSQSMISLREKTNFFSRTFKPRGADTFLSLTWQGRYIGELMSTSKITATGSNKSKGKGSRAK
jgi:hypothetical protein